MSAVARRLADHYGPHIYSTERSSLDSLLFSLLAQSSPVTNARKAMREAREAFVDWNEVRMATVRDLEDVLAPVRITDPGAAAQKLRSTLRAIADAFYSLQIDTFKDRESASITKSLTLLTGLPEGAGSYFLTVAGISDEPPLEAVAERVLSRLGVLKDLTEARQRKVLAELFQGEDAIRFHHLMTEHGKKLCLDSSPKCARCPVQKDCAFANQVTATKPARKKAATTKKTAAAKKAAARKTGQKKTATAKRATRGR
jgi:endonuclease III